MTLVERIEMALGAMQGAGPGTPELSAQPGPDLPKASTAEVDTMIDSLLVSDPNGSGKVALL